jgi:PAS domain S-box-containing protein
MTQSIMANRTFIPVIPGLVILFLVIPAAVHAQSFLSKTYSISDGLASPTINDITQDKKGVMWFATLQGVTCYDGTTWKNYSELDGLADTEYFRIRADVEGHIWALTRYLNDGIFFFDGSRWRHIKRPEGPGHDDRKTIEIKAAVMMDRDQNSRDEAQLGIGTAENGFYIYRCKQKRWIHTPGLPTVFAVDVYKRTFYLAARSGLFLIDAAQPRECIRKDVNVPSLPIYALTIEKEPEPLIWLTGEKWAGYCSLNKNKNNFHLLYRGQFPGFRFDYHYEQLVTLPDRFGGLWVGSRVVLLNIDKTGSLANIGSRNSFQGEGSYAIFYDRESNLWVGTFRGISKIVSFRFTNYNKLSGLYDDEVTAISELGQVGRVDEAKPVNMVFGHHGGFSFLSNNNIYIHKIPLESKNVYLDSRVLDMCRDREGNVWAAVSRIGIVRINPSRKMTWYKNLEPEPRGYQHYYSSVLADDRGGIWASVNNRVFKWDSRESRFIIKARIDTPDNIRRLFRGQGVIYIAFNNSGIFRLNQLKGNGVAPVFVPGNNDPKSVFAVYPDKEGDLLLGTNDGLFILKEGALIKFQRQWFQLENPVYFITGDNEGYLWFGLNNGVVRWEWDTQDVRHYKMQDGLAGNETNRAAGFVDSQGRVWIGTELGVSCYNRERDSIYRPPPLLELLYLEVSGSKYPLDRDHVLEYSPGDLTFHFRAISFIDEKSLTYNFKLEGFDDHWTTDFHSPDNHIRFTHVPAGNYRFYIQAVSSAGVVSDIIFSGMITVKKPASRTWWFYFLFFMVLSVLIFLITNFFSRKRYALRLAEQVRQRTRQLAVSEKELRDIFNTAHDAIVIFEPVQEIIYDVNQRACDMYGFTRPEFIGMSMETITKDVRRGKEKIAETLRRGNYLNFETVHYRKEGTEMIVEVNAAVMNYRGKPAVLSINRDITGRKHAEQQIKRSLKEKEIMLKEIHHRVKNNLQIISSLLDLQADTLSDTNVFQAFQDSKNRIRSMALVHENLYQSGDLARIDTEDYIKSVVDYFFSSYGQLEDRIVPIIHVENISLDMDTAVPIGLILTELLGNALKHAFLPGQKGRLTVRFRSQGKSSLILMVRDNGVGLPEKMDLKAPKSLGLQLVTLLTRQLGGAIEVERRSGTAFKVTFPYPGQRKNSGLEE